MILAIANQKGGVAKTTTVACLGVAFAEHGLRVLLVDLDAQSSLTFSLGLDPDQVGLSIFDLIVNPHNPHNPHDPDAETLLPAATLPVGEGLDLVPATIDLSIAESQLLPRPAREFVLQTVLAPARDDYDVIILDCSPSLGVLTLNALTAADELVIPLQCEMLSHRGVGQLLDTVADVQRLLNPALIVRGLLPTMFDARTTHAQAVLADVEQRYGLPILRPAIPRSIRFAEAPALGRTVLETARGSKGAKAYRDVALALLGSWQLEPGRRTPAGP